MLREGNTNFDVNGHYNKKTKFPQNVAKSCWFYVRLLGAK